MKKQQLNLLRKLNLTAGVLHVLLFMTFLALMASFWGDGREFKGINTASFVTQPVFERVNINDELLQVTGSIPEEPQYSIVKFEAQGIVESSQYVLPVLILGFVGITAFFHFMVASRWKKSYEDNLNQGVNPYRWTEYSITATIMLVIVVLSLGLKEFNAILAIVPLCALIMLAGGVIEEDAHGPAKRTTRALVATVVTWLAFALLWTVPTVAFVKAINSLEDARSSNYSDDLDDFSVFIYLGYVVITVFYASFGVWQTWNVLRPEKSSAYRREIGYVALSFTSKAFLVGLLMWGLYGRSQNSQN